MATRTNNNNQVSNAHATTSYECSVQSIQENGVNSTLVLNLDREIKAMNKDFSAEEPHSHMHMSVTKLLSNVKGKEGRYLKFKVGNCPHKYEGVTPILCLLYENASIKFDRVWKTKGTIHEGMALKADMWVTENFVPTFGELTQEDKEILAMLLAEVKPKAQNVVKPLF